MPVPAEPVTDLASPDFAAAVAELAGEFYGEEPPPVPLREVIGYLVSDRWAEEVPTASELPAVLADYFDIPVEDLGPAQVQGKLRELAHLVAQRSTGPTATGARPGP